MALRHCTNLDVISIEDERSRSLVVGEPVSVFRDVFGATAHVEDVLEEGGVVAGPVGLPAQDGRQIVSSHVA